MGTAVGDEQQFQLNQCTLIYDGDCRFCVTSKERIERMSPPNQSAFVRYIPYQSAVAKDILGSEYRSGRPEVAYLIDADGQIRKGLDAILPLLLHFPGGRVIFGLLAIPGCRTIASWLYRLLARHRYRWFGSMPDRPK